MSFVKGFGGMRVRNNRLIFNPVLPEKWEGYSFCINFRGATIKMEVNRQGVVIENHSPGEITIELSGKELVLAPEKQVTSAINT